MLPVNEDKSKLPDSTQSEYPDAGAVAMAGFSLVWVALVGSASVRTYTSKTEVVEA